MNKVKWLLELLFKALGLHDGTKKLLLVFVILTVLQMPFSVPGLWRMGWGIWLSWKNDTVLAVPRPSETYRSSDVAGGDNTPHRIAKGKPHHYTTAIPLPAKVNP